MLASSSPHLTRSQLLRLCQTPGPDCKIARGRLVDQFGKDLERLTKRTCRRYYLRPQEQGDVLAETYQQILNPEITRFVPKRGKPEDYFEGLVKNAARKIMTQLGRRQKSELQQADSAVSAAPHNVGEEGGKHYRMSAAPPSPPKHAEMHDTVNFILDQAPPRVRRALQLSYWEQWSLQSIATHLGVSRFVLAREIRGFFEKINSQLGDG